MHPNIYVGRRDGSAMYQQWYFEAIIDHLEVVSNVAPHIRVGWANTDGYVPYPGSGAHWGCNGVGADLFSYGFDGVNLWTGQWRSVVICGYQNGVICEFKEMIKMLSLTQ